MTQVEFEDSYRYVLRLCTGMNGAWVLKVIQLRTFCVIGILL